MVIGKVSAVGRMGAVVCKLEALGCVVVRAESDGSKTAAEVLVSREDLDWIAAAVAENEFVFRIAS